MENVLDIYKRPYDPKHPVVCFDETNKQLVKENKTPLVAEPGQVERYDYEYERNGVSNLFMFSEPLAGWRHVEVTERRTKKDYAHQLKSLQNSNSKFEKSGGISGGQRVKWLKHKIKKVLPAIKDKIGSKSA
jgi:hypothetical protein